VKNLCGLFVRIIDSKIYLVHQTAREFLIKETSTDQGNWQYTLSPIDSSFLLADICISYLLLDEFENDPLVADIHCSTGRRAVDNYLQRYAFLDYAASHWADHFRDSQHRQMELFERTCQICRGGSNRFRTWLKVYWRNLDEDCPFPNSLTHLMIASWLGQRMVVDRLLEKGEDVQARSREYGTALNMAALRGDQDIATALVERNAIAYIRGKGYNISNMKRSELENLKRNGRESVSERD